MIVPILLGQLLCFIVCSCNVTHLTLDIFQFWIIPSDLASENRTDEYSNEEKEKCDHNRLRHLLDQTTWYLCIQNGEGIVLVAMELDPYNLLHGLQ